MRIAFYPAQAGKPFTGDTLEKESLGGSETAVIYVARELAKLGHEVLVFSRGKPGVYDDVVYLDFNKAKNILRTLPLDVLVCSRDPLPLVWRHNAKLTIFWSHDLPQGRLAPANLYAFVSNWHAQTYIQNGFVKAEQAAILPNGVDLKLFETPQPIENLDYMYNLAWTSNPERGLWYMGEVLQIIRKKYQHAALHVFGRNSVYGWASSNEGNFLPDDMTNVFLHPAKTKKELALALRETDLWVYPTWWPETYCIAAVEAQAAGVPIVASKFGALTETVQGGILIEGRPVDEGHIELMAQAAISLLENTEERQRLREEGLAFAKTQSWEAAAASWHAVFLEGMKRL